MRWWEDGQMITERCLSEKGRTDTGFGRVSLSVLLVALVDDYGDPARGDSYEKINFLYSLRGMGHRVTSFDPCREIRNGGKIEANRRLIKIVDAEMPDVLLFVPFEDQIDPGTLNWVTSHTKTITAAWFCDDQWRFDDHSRHFSPNVDWAITTFPAAVTKHEAAGQENVILTTWAANHRLYRPNSLSSKYDATFVGMAHGKRPEMIRELKRVGIDVEVWGHGWPNGRLTTRQMIEVFGRSAICLNLSNASRPDAPQQIKGRHFEIPACGGFQITTSVDGISDCFVQDKEIAVALNEQHLAEEIKAYLAAPKRRGEIARAGYERVLKDHTWDHRFDGIFERIRLEEPKAVKWGKPRGKPTITMVTNEPGGRARFDDDVVPLDEAMKQAVRQAEIDSGTTSNLAAEAAKNLISIVILNRNGKNRVEECLTSLRDHTCGKIELILVDNGSGPVSSFKALSG